MNDLFLTAPDQATPAALPALPEPTRLRWQPLRMGLVELFHYDSEEFWFRDGHLLLRGNNGTGKSKVLSLTLPFLFDAQLKSSRIEPDGDAGKKMAWNLLLGKHERRLGYTWVEFGRLADDGQPEYLTLGCGMAALAARTGVDSWFFMTERQRMGQDLWLINPQRAVLTKDRLGAALGVHGQVFDTAGAYRRAVDERLFHLGEVRYGALMDTLIQLRQPQLSRKPNEDNLSGALTEALPPLPDDLLGDVAEAMSQLEEYRAQLQELIALHKAIAQFNRSYQVYARIDARRHARTLRTAQTGFDNASRDLHDARAALQAAQQAEAKLQAQIASADAMLLRERAALAELQADPTMRDAHRLEESARHTDLRRRDMMLAQAALEEAFLRQRREDEAAARSGERAGAARAALDRALEPAALAAADAGLADRDDCRESIALLGAPELLAQADAGAVARIQQSLLALAARRRDDLAALRRRLRALETAERERQQDREGRDRLADELADMVAQVAAAELQIEQCGAALVGAWQDHAGTLRELRLDDADAVLASLADWVRALEGEDPALAALLHAQQQASERLALQLAEARQQFAALEAQLGELRAEQEALDRGEDQRPPAPYHRDASARAAAKPGAPLWQLVEFREASGASAGLEAALEAAGLLDAWVTPEGVLLSPDGFDTMLVARTSQSPSLADWLEPASGAPVDPALVARLLRSIACGESEAVDAEAWVAPDGRFRLGPLRGAWNKPAAEYIGAASRALARRRRLDELTSLIADLLGKLAASRAQEEDAAVRQMRAADEWRLAPSDEAVRAAHVNASGLERQRRALVDRLAQAQARLAAADERWQIARAQLLQDGEDLRLPVDAGGLASTEAGLMRFEAAVQALLIEVNNLRHALPEHARQLERASEAAADVAGRRLRREQAGQELDEMAARLQTLRATVGVKVEELMQRLAASRVAVEEGEKLLRDGTTALIAASGQLARSEQRVKDGAATLDERTAARHQAIASLERFAATGLLAVALPELDTGSAQWTIEAALNIARRAEQGLQDVSADDEDWNRIQNLVSRDYPDLLSALTALGHQAQADTTDFGLVVTIIYQNRPERPDLIELRITEEIAQRKELLTARETEVLENHLQAEVAAAIQRLLQDAEGRLDAINAELAKRPTSTGVRFKLVWEPLPAGSEGAPVGLDTARKRLLNTSFDAWSEQDRMVVGAMLQNRISSERARADAEQGGGGSLLEMLGRALDYRRWHRFRVLRWQDGQWRPLSGPASSGERALGLTVPLFAAVSSFYSHGGSPHAPRLVLLDEAFAGIDDAARAHCMALVREFDLDFVMTSEREWACYAELPGVSICQLQRHEGIDAVYVSRWSWDGRARRPEPDGARRFPDSEV
ncbi:TIGR02680 family protein [Massilia sp. R2A-15]|uniref:TIGR02680 family protein n=1 Tax=Massilia sp. R2A-15 TaxID=3064278 RepID=UPI002732812D|nr:TIGR02680 family protein [Massilia sp. R2A-15]WLI89654.1 TIGR02680 family protein [Massilia sp. R2A-15]